MTENAFQFRAEVQNYHQHAPIALHQCNICNKTFVSYKSLQVHTVIHTDTKPFECEICGKCFRFKSNLFEHRSVHTGVAIHQCPFCAKRFRLKGNMKKHMRTHVATKEELEIAFSPYASLRRRTDIPTNPVIVRGPQLPLNFNLGIKPRRMKLSITENVEKWLERIQRGELIKINSIDEKISRLQDYLYSCTLTMKSIQECKYIEFEVFMCPICKLFCAGNLACQEHMTIEHKSRIDQLASNTNYCNKCAILFANAEMLRQHEQYHVKVQQLIDAGNLILAEPQLLTSDTVLCDLDKSPFNEYDQHYFMDKATSVFSMLNDDSASQSDFLLPSDQFHVNDEEDVESTTTFSLIIEHREGPSSV
ncbi:unnamed protein product [Caenorhabditis bovis]|uniref:C2H2-type domain-containing protein n=1 Tax=Caenorhabditis bovis TaxID=2654633 RepID=A0A8S1F5Y9_9PELO|nr:unnamed protein product [Caenorhabditis bovis]